MRVLLAAQEPSGPGRVRFLVGDLTIPVDPSRDVDGGGRSRPVQGDAPGDDRRALLQFTERATTAAM